MARFEITGPDGVRYEVEAPDEAAVTEAVQKMFGGAASSAEPYPQPIGPGLLPDDYRRMVGPEAPTLPGSNWQNYATAGTGPGGAPATQNPVPGQDLGPVEDTWPLPGPNLPQRIGQGIVQGGEGLMRGVRQLNERGLPPAGNDPLGRLYGGAVRGLQNTQEAAVSAAGFPVDTAAAVANAARFGINEMLGQETSRESLKLPTQRLNESLRSNFGEAATDPEKLSFPDRIVWEAQQLGTGGMLGGGALAVRGSRRAAELASPNAPQAARLPQPLDAVSAPYAQAPGQGIARDTAAGAGAGAMIPFTQDYLPEKSQGIRNFREQAGGLGGVLMDLAGGLAGGVAGTTGYGIGRGGSNALINYARGKQIDPTMPLLDGQGSAVSNAGADAAATLFQGLVRDPAMAVQTMDDNIRALEPSFGNRLPSVPVLMQEPGLMGLQRSFALENPAPKLQRDADVNAAMRDIVDRSAPEDATSQTLIDAAQQEANRRRGEAEAAAQQQVAAARGEVDTARTQLEQAEAERLRQGGELKPLEKGTALTQASERLDREVVGRQFEPDREAKNRAFDSIDPDAKEIVDAAPVIASAKRVRDAINSLGPEKVQLPAEFVQKLERLAPDIEQQTQTSPVLDASGNPITRTVEVNRGGEGKAVLRHLVDLQKYIGRAYDDAQKAGNFDLATNIAELRRGLQKTVEEAPAAAEANRLYKEEFAPTYRPGRGDEMAKFTKQIDRDPTRSTTPPSQTAGRFIRPDQPERIAALRRVVDKMEDPTAANAAARDYVLADMVANGGILDTKGRVNVNALRSWANQWEGGLDVAPGVRDEVDDLLRRAQRGEQMSAKFTKDLRDAEAKFRDTEVKAGRSVRDVENQINKGALGMVLDADPDKAVAAIMNNRTTSGKKLRELVDLTAGNDRARDGLKASLRDYLIDRATSNATQKMPAGDDRLPVNREGLMDIFNEHEKELALVYRPKEMNDMRALHRAVKLAGIENLRASPGADTAQKMKENPVDKFLETSVGRAADAGARLTFGMLKGGGIIATARRVAGGITPRRYQEALKLVEAAGFDPVVARLLMGRDLPVGSPKWNNAMRNALSASVLFTGDDEAQPEKDARERVPRGTRMNFEGR